MTDRAGEGESVREGKQKTKYLKLISQKNSPHRIKPDFPLALRQKIEIGQHMTEAEAPGRRTLYTIQFVPFVRGLLVANVRLRCKG